LSVGFLLTGPVSGWLSDRYGARPFAVGGLDVVAESFIALALLPMNFPYWLFALVTAASGPGIGNLLLPRHHRHHEQRSRRPAGRRLRMRATFFNSGSAFSIGICFSLMIVGLSSTLSGAMRTGLTAQHVPVPVVDQVAGLSPVGSLFSAFWASTRCARC